MSTIQDGMNFLGLFVEILDKVFEAMAGELPSVHQQMEHSASVLTEYLSSQGRSSLARPLTDALQATEEFSGRLGQMKSGLCAIRQQLADIEPPLVALRETIAAVIPKASDLKLISINALVSARRVGSGGDVIGIITQQLIEASRSLSQLTTEFVDEISGIQRRMEEREQADRKMLSILGELSVIAGRDILDAQRLILKDLSQIQDTARRTADHIQRILASIGEIMGVVQKQDLIRQGILHISVVLQEIATQPSTPSSPVSGGAGREGAAEILTFQQKAGELCGRLYEENRSELDTFLRETGALLTNLDEVLSRLGDLLSGSCAPQLRPETILAPLQKLRFSLGRVCGIDEHCRETRALGGEICRSSHNIAMRLEKLGKLAGDTSNIELMMRVKTAHQADLATSVSHLSQDIKKLVKSIEHHAGIASRCIEQIDELSSCATGRRLDDERDASPLGDLEARLDALGSEIERSLGQLNQVLAVLSQEVEEVRRSCNRFRPEFERLRDLFQGKVELVDLFAEIRKRADLDMQRLRQAEPEALAEGSAGNGTFETLIERFTVLAHKKLAQDVSGVRVEDGDQAGRLTLF